MSNPEGKGSNPHNHPSGKSDPNVTRLSPTTFIKGELRGNENLIIQGKFHGKIHLETCDVTVESDAKVKAEIRVKNIMVRGSVEGNIHATGKVFIDKDGQMIGDISASRISIMEGAQFKGSIKMLSAVK